jgi:hypothetical protein
MYIHKRIVFVWVVHYKAIAIVVWVEVIKVCGIATHKGMDILLALTQDTLSA